MRRNARRAYSTQIECQIRENSSSAKKICKVALSGFGTVGSSVAKILCERTNAQLRLTHISIAMSREKKWTGSLPKSSWTENIDDILASDADIVVEVMGGLQPTEDWIRRALAIAQIGGHCQQANDCALRPGTDRPRAPNEAADRIRRVGCRRIPVISGLHEGLAGDELFKIRGILNGTCNYILSQIESNGVPFRHRFARSAETGLRGSRSHR